MSSQLNARVIRFGLFELDVSAGELRKENRKIKLQEQPFQVLVLLLSRPGELVAREELQQALWPGDTFVEFDQGLNTAIKKIRLALGDSADNPRFVETLPRKGYRFIAPVDRTAGEVSAQPVPVDGNPLGPPAIEPVKRRSTAILAWVLFGAVSVAAAVLLRWHRPPSSPRSNWVQITNFPDGATSPALSSDGRMITFIRGPETFVTPGQIYVKLLPDGKPVQLTHDDLPKMAPAFSPDGSRIAYTATGASFAWNTWVVPVFGGEPQQTLPNAAALTWIDREHILFSELKTGIWMALATASESRAGERDVYVPADKAGMAHRSWLSPNRKWVLVSEMDGAGWLPCRVLPFDGGSAGEVAGPRKSKCTYAGWSPDGKWMYFSADPGDGFHIWRQRFPEGTPEQITSGPTEQEGIAIAPDGKSLVTSVGIQQGSVWVHDAHGDRQISSEGFATLLGVGWTSDPRSVFSPDGKQLFYLVRKEGSRAWNAGELWKADLDSGRTQAVLPGVLMNDFNLAPDGKRVAYSSFNAEGSSRVWVAPLDHREAPHQVTSFESDTPFFGPAGDVFFRGWEDNSEFVYGVGQNDGKPRKTSPNPATGFILVSPDGEWWLSGHKGGKTAQPMHGGSTIRICDFCEAAWGPEGKSFYVMLREAGVNGGKVHVIALHPGKSIPSLPPGGIRSADDLTRLNVVAVIDMTAKSIFAPGPNPAIYAYSRITVQRNLFRIPLD